MLSDAHISSLGYLSKSICVQWPLSVKQAAQLKYRTFQSIIYLAEEKNLLEQAAFWHEVKVV